MNKRILTLTALLAVAFSLNAQADTRTTKAKAESNKAEAVKTTDRASEPVRVVYHVNEGNDQATQALRNIRNHLEADPTAKIVVVTHANGIDFLLDGAADKNGNSFEVNVQELKGCQQLRIIWTNSDIWYNLFT